VLTHAGKPVFINRKEEEGEEDNVTNLIGVMHALISVFEDDNDKIRCGSPCFSCVVSHLIKVHFRAASTNNIHVTASTILCLCMSVPGARVCGRKLSAHHETNI
jgi:hypothetical protein